MASTKERISKIVADSFDLDQEPDFDRSFSDAGISSMEAVAFYKLVNEEFELGLAPEDCLQFRTLQDLVAYIDARG